jgi:UPF0716 protein FxsA
MLFKLLLLFILAPLIELALLVYVGTLIGPWYTILIVVATGILGAVLAKRQGTAIVNRIRSSLQQDMLPSGELFAGALIFIGGLVLLTPGIITDILGFALLIPQTRQAVAGWLRRAIQRRIERGDVHYWRMEP